MTKTEKVWACTMRRIGAKKLKVVSSISGNDFSLKARVFGSKGSRIWVML